MKPMTPKQRKLYNFVKAYRNRHGFGPTYGEIAEGLKVTHTPVFAMVHALVRNGHLTITGENRGVDTVSVPPETSRRVMGSK
jgi:SOS-response transcriptional repressor LexA